MATQSLTEAQRLLIENTARVWHDVTRYKPWESSPDDYKRTARAAAYAVLVHLKMIGGGNGSQP